MFSGSETSNSPGSTDRYDAGGRLLGHASAGPGIDGIHRHAVAGELAGGDDRQGGDAGLRRSVVGLPGIAEEARRRRWY